MVRGTARFDAFLVAVPSSTRGGQTKAGWRYYSGNAQCFGENLMPVTSHVMLRRAGRHTTLIQQDGVQIYSKNSNELPNFTVLKVIRRLVPEKAKVHVQ